MADRRFNQFRLSLEPRVVDLFVQMTIGATGSVSGWATTDQPYSKGISSVSRTSAGLYVITLDSVYNGLLFADFKLLAATGTVAPECKLVSFTGGNVLTIQFVNYTSSSNTTQIAADPTPGDVVLGKIILSNTVAI